MIRSRLRQAKRGSSGFNFPGAPFPVSFAYDFLSSANPVIGGGTTATVIDADGTYINSAGIITQKTANVWPLDYSPSTLQPLGRPVWEGRTNLALQSILPGGGAAPTGWTQATVPATPAAPIASIYGNGDGATAYLFTTAADRSFFTQTTPSLSTSTTYTYSVYVEAQSLSNRNADNTILASALPAGATLVYPVCEANPSGGVGGQITTGRLNIQIVVAGTAGTAVLRFGAGVSTTQTGTVRISRPQLEAGSFPTPYIPTTTAAVTRAADACSIALGPWFNATEGTFVWEFITSNVGAARFYGAVNNGTANEELQFYYVAFPAAYFAVLDGGVLQAQISGGVFTNGAITRTASGYQLNNFATSANGQTPQIDTSGTLPTVTTIQFGTAASGTSFLNGWLRKLYYSPIRQPDGILQRASR